MNFTEFNKKYKNLIFAPLGIPDIPISADALSEWTAGVDNILQEATNILYGCLKTLDNNQIIVYNDI